MKLAVGSSSTFLPQLVGMLFLLGQLLLQDVAAEIRDFEMVLPPISKYVHFTDGFLITPGTVDLRRLHFKPAGDKVETGIDGQIISENDDNQGDTNNNPGGHARMLRDGMADRGRSESIVDVVVLHLPQSCDRTRQGCDWTELGIGKRSEEAKVVRYCCSNEAVQLGLCAPSNYGRLIMDANKFDGEHRFIAVPTEGDFDYFIKYGEMKQAGENGRYALAMANCNDEGRPVLVKGKTIWMSKHGYLPGDLFGLMYFFAAVTALYFVLLLWYGISMRINEDDNIPIQRWILVTIAMGTLELFFRTGDLFVWNEDGTRFWFAFSAGITLGIFKRGISRGLLVMLSLGWGVVRDDLGPVMKKIKFVVLVYIIVSFVRDSMNIIGALEVHKISEEEETEIVDVVDILTVVIALLEVMFYFWIIDSLNATMDYLENMSQTLKLLRYLRLRFVLLISILFAIMWAVFAIVDSKDQGIVTQESRW
mmetsp:Transcript_22147/g.61613  ORF Transcript_22147/g.61613 Transcript_22147/m.61613 type:complete len:478 (-) Transcript_22147:1313-2746(-)